ncbi:MAG: hypothetical protein EXS29_00355 [Pedosphaera sp.]|nr:hypothetical protein [Pedosphaera sp.]MSS99755.1 hypothetical protein [Pedosphaera sp.]
MILRARVVLPISRPPIENGAVAVEDGRITAVGAWPELARTPAGEIKDLGEVVLLPGLVNAHCHLDYTAMAGQIAPTKSFTDWIKCITALKASWSYSEFAESWVSGARMLLATGTTTVADIEAVPELLSEAWLATPLRILSFLEMTGIKSRRQPERILEEVLAKIDSLPIGRCRAGLSPHAPYSTQPDLLRLVVEHSRKRNLRITTHVAESAEEFEMFFHARGAMYDWLCRNERMMDDCGRGSPVKRLEESGLLGENLLAVHANYLHTGDAALLAGTGANVVHCPRSHEFFQHCPFPFRELNEAGVNICLGTDSLATTRKMRGEPLRLDLFAEMRAFSKANPARAPDAILQMATLNGAKALGMAGQIGELTPGASADLIVVPSCESVGQCTESIIHHADDVIASMIDGCWALPPQS